MDVWVYGCMNEWMDVLTTGDTGGVYWCMSQALKCRKSKNKYTPPGSHIMVIGQGREYAMH